MQLCYVAIRAATNAICNVRMNRGNGVALRAATAILDQFRSICEITSVRALAHMREAASLSR